MIMHTHTIPATPHKRTLAALGGGLIAAAALLFSAAAPAAAHDELVSTGTVVDPSDGALTGVTFTFSNNIIEVGTEVVITDESGESIADGEAVVDGATVTQAIMSDLDEGRYPGAWRVVSSDGHPIEGVFWLDVKTDGAGEIIDVAIMEDDPRFAQDAAAEGQAETTVPAPPGADLPEQEADSENAANGTEQETETTEEPAGLGAGAITAIVAGGAIVVVGAVLAIVVGQRRRAAAMREAGASNEINGADGADANGEER